jgi:hypothetical protein
MKNTKSQKSNFNFNRNLKGLMFLVFFLIICSSSNLLAQVKLNNLPITNGKVRAIKRIDNRIFLGGEFDSVGGFARKNFCAIDAITGSVLAFNPGPNNAVREIHVSQNKLIVVGLFDSIVGSPAKRIIFFDLTTLNILPITYVNEFIRGYSVAVDGGYLYYKADGFLPPYSYISRINIASQQLDTNWRCSLLGNSPTGWLGIALEGNFLYFLSPDFNYSFGTSSSIEQVCRFDRNTLQIDTTWMPITIKSISSHPERLKYYNGKIYIGGNFDIINGLSRNGIIEIDTAGQITNKVFNLSNDEVSAWFFQGNTIWIGSNSYVIGGMNRPRLGQVNLSTGFATCWDATSLGIGNAAWIISVDVHQDTVYAGGMYSSSSFNYFTGMVGNPSYINAGPDLSICPPAPFTLNAQNAGFQSYLWSNGGTTASITSAVPGLYWVTASNTSLGCSATDSVYVDFCTSLEDPDEKDLLKVVQPVGDYLQFKIENRVGNADMKIDILDLTGRFVISSVVSSGENSIPVSSLKPSIYLFIENTDS